MTQFLVAWFLVSLTSSTVRAQVIVDGSEKVWSVQAAPQDPFQQFKFVVTGSCADGSVGFTHAGSVVGADFGKDPKGRPAFADVTLQLFSDGTYWVEYDEWAVVRVEGSSRYLERLFEKRIEGRWTINGIALVLDGLGRGTMTRIVDATSQKPRDVINLTLDRPVNHPRVMAASILLGRVSSNQGPKGISINEYCGR